MGSIEIKYKQNTDGHFIRGPYAYYITREGGKKKKRYLGKVPHWYAKLFSREVIEKVKGE